MLVFFNLFPLVLLIFAQITLEQLYLALNIFFCVIVPDHSLHSCICNKLMLDFLAACEVTFATLYVGLKTFFIFSFLMS